MNRRGWDDERRAWWPRSLTPGFSRKLPREGICFKVAGTVAIKCFDFLKILWVILISKGNMRIENQTWISRWSFHVFLHRCTSIWTSISHMNRCSSEIFHIDISTSANIDILQMRWVLLITSTFGIVSATQSPAVGGDSVEIFGKKNPVDSTYAM